MYSRKNINSIDNYSNNNNNNNITSFMISFPLTSCKFQGEPMALQKLYIVPIILFMILPATFVVTYTIAVSNDHVPVTFPYISESGDFPPESCIFSLCLNIAAFIMALCVYVRYLQVHHYPDLVPSAPEVNPKINIIGLILGWLSCIGLDLVANFQEINALAIHSFGALMCFGTGTLYFLVQVWISHKMPKIATKRLIAIRAFLVLICMVMTVTTMVSGSIFMRKLRALFPEETFEKKVAMKPEYDGWHWYLTSTITEWILCITYSIVILTFVPELYDLELVAPIIRYKSTRSVVCSKRRLDA